MLVYPIVRREKVGNDIDVMRTRICETQANSDGFAFGVNALDRFGCQLEGFMAGLILASVQRNAAKDKGEEREECLSHARTVRGIGLLV
jgi:hypothetical protein